MLLKLRNITKIFDYGCSLPMPGRECIEKIGFIEWKVLHGPSKFYGI
jgi:hypothetical protein